MCSVGSKREARGEMMSFALAGGRGAMHYCTVPAQLHLWEFLL